MAPPQCGQRHSGRAVSVGLGPETGCDASVCGTSAKQSGIAWLLRGAVPRTPSLANL
jgi:hypothetical protein